MRREFGDVGGQTLVELIALVPLVVICGALGLQMLVAGAVYVQADSASHAAALATQLGRDPLVAARSAAPGWSTGQLRVTRNGSRLTVVIRPRTIFTPLARLLTTRSSARILTATVAGRGS
ncbi:MAG: hypothetical protein WAP35_07045 [Solirubrobacterales bacterium]